MARVIVGMTTSGMAFVNDRNASVERLYPDLEALAKTEFLKEMIAYTGAVGSRARRSGSPSAGVTVRI